ncbi:Poly [ADP-ribose] polymerase 2-A [Glycine soja]
MVSLDSTYDSQYSLSWYNAKKLPLGKLSKSTILKGYEVLKRLANVIDKGDRKVLKQLSGEFFTVIPHDFGFKKVREFVIDTPQKLKRKLEMVEALAEIEVATKLLKDDAEMQGDPLYTHYQRLHCELALVEFGCVEFSMDIKRRRGRTVQKVKFICFAISYCSTKGLGGTAPDPSKAQELEDGLVVPLGKPKTESGKKGDLLYNEYIVYNVEQIRMRYIVHLNFNFKTTS